MLDATLDASTTDDAEWEISGGPPSPCDVSFLNDNVLINGRSNLSRTPRNHKVSELYAVIMQFFRATLCSNKFATEGKFASRFKPMFETLPVYFICRIRYFLAYLR